MKMVKESSGKIERAVGNCRERDCLTKKLILETIGAYPSTVKEIYALSGYKGTYNTFTGLLCKYRNYGYVYREGHKPFTYKLTDLGRIHVENPYLAREELEQRYIANLKAATLKGIKLMSKDEKKEAFKDISDEDVAEIFKGRYYVPPVIKAPDVKKVNVTEKIVNLKEPAKDLPKPSGGTSGSFDTSDYDKDKIIAEQLETIHDQAQTIAELRNTPAHITVPKQTTSASHNDDLHKHDALYLKYKNRVVDSAFFTELRYGLYEFTGTDSNNLSKAVRDILNSKVLKKGHIIFESYNAGGALKKYDQARRLTEEELKKYSPTLQFGKEEVNLSIRYKNHTYNFFICSVASLKKPVRGFVKPPVDVPHSSY